MCLDAIWSRIGRVYFPVNRHDAAGIEFRDDFIYAELAPVRRAGLALPRGSLSAPAQSKATAEPVSEVRWPQGSSETQRPPRQSRCADIGWAAHFPANPAMSQFRPQLSSLAESCRLPAWGSSQLLPPCRVGSVVVARVVLTVGRVEGRRNAVAATASAPHPLHRSSLLVLTPTLQRRPPAAGLGPAIRCRLNPSAWVLLGLLLSSWLLALVVQAIPPVATLYREWPSGTCRTVVSADGLPGGCAQLPPFHDVVWVSASSNGPAPAERHPRG